MSLLPEIADPYITALVGGFLYGLVACTSTCLPYVASYIAGINADFRKGVAVTFTFNMGRLTSYAIIGAIIGAFKLLIDGSLLAAFQSYSSFAFAIVTIIIGVTILLRNKSSKCNCSMEAQGNERSKFLGKIDLRAYSLGLTRGLILCVPMLTIIAYSVAFASAFDTFALAVLFGLGTALSPILLLGGATGWLLNKAPLFRKWISRLGAAALITLGLITLLDAIII